MGVRKAWEAFQHFETLVRRRRRPNGGRHAGGPESAAYVFLAEWEAAARQLADAAPGCRYPDALLAFKLLLAYRPAKSELELIISRLEEELADLGPALLPQVVESLLLLTKGAESCVSASSFSACSPLVKLEEEEEQQHEDPSCLKIALPTERPHQLTDIQGQRCVPLIPDSPGNQLIAKAATAAYNLSTSPMASPNELCRSDSDCPVKAPDKAGGKSWLMKIGRKTDDNGYDSDDAQGPERHDAVTKTLRKPRCRLCQTVCDSRPALRKHRRIHHHGAAAAAAACDQCDKSFPSAERLKRHYRVHTGEKPFGCDVCTKRYSHYSVLHAHRQRHAGRRNFLCEICNKTFLFKKDLDRHLDFHSAERPFKCGLCPSAFRRKDFLADHARIHTGERNYQCEFCSKAFRLRVSLARHTRIHTGEKPYQCEVCLRRFVQCGDMKKHRRIHDRKAKEEAEKAPTASAAAAAATGSGGVS